MTRDDIIRMAIECQLVTTGNRDGVYMDALERFAAMIAAAEREACAKACEDEIKRCSSSIKTPLGFVPAEEWVAQVQAATRARGEG